MRRTDISTKLRGALSLPLLGEARPSRLAIVAKAEKIGTKIQISRYEHEHYSIKPLVVFLEPATS